MPKLYDRIPILSVKDIGIRKLEAMHHRATNKDAYDLDFITEMIPLTKLLKAKKRYAKKLRQGGVFYRKGE